MIVIYLRNIYTYIMLLYTCMKFICTESNVIYCLNNINFSTFIFMMKINEIHNSAFACNNQSNLWLYIICNCIIFITFDKYTNIAKRRKNIYLLVFLFFRKIIVSIEHFLFKQIRRVVYLSTTRWSIPNFFFYFFLKVSVKLHFQTGWYTSVKFLKWAWTTFSASVYFLPLLSQIRCKLDRNFLL